MSNEEAAVKSVTDYLAKQGESFRRPLVAELDKSVDRVVAIPALNENAYLFKTLEGLSRNPPESLQTTLVICVVNNRSPDIAGAEAVEDNHETLNRLSLLAKGQDPNIPRIKIDPRLTVGFVDASSPGFEFAPKDGVGLARKIAMDNALKLLTDHGNLAAGTILSLDADTLVEPSYVSAIHDALTEPAGWGAVVQYAHPFSGNENEQRAIACYELYLRYFELGLRYARSPYAFHTIGSAMACTAPAYAAVSGMNRRQAAEDFYFLMKLAKTGSIRYVTNTTVHPSGRSSGRVPFGTGARVRRFLEGRSGEYNAYHPRSFEVLREWIQCVVGSVTRDPGACIDQAKTISPTLDTFLRERKFPQAWERLQQNARDEPALVQHFHRWFDGLKTYQLIRRLSDEFPDKEIAGSIAFLASRMGWPLPELLDGPFETDLPAQKRLLRRLRELSAEKPAIHGVGAHSTRNRSKFVQ